MNTDLKNVGASDRKASDVPFHPLRDGLLAAVAILTVSVLSVAGLYLTSRSIYVRQVQQGLSELAQVAASQVDPDLHQTLVSPERENTPEYRRAVAPLEKIMRGVPNIRFLYTVVLIGNRPHFILDATPRGDADHDGVEDHSGVMEPYDDPDEEMLTALREGRIVTMDSPKADKWGPVLSAYAPFHDATGRLLGVIGVDITAQEYAARLSTLWTSALVAFVPATLLSLLVGLQVFHSQRRKRKHAIDRHLSQKALAEALARFEYLVENAPVVAVQGFDRQGMVCHWNRASASLFGLSAAEAVGRRFHDLTLAPDNQHAFEIALEEIWSTGQPTLPREWTVRTQDGDVRWIFASMFPVFSGGAVVEVFSMAVDISERKRHEEEMAEYAAALKSANEDLKRYSDAAEQATRAKSIFLANMSHEIRTPMAAILGYCDLVSDPMADQAERQNAVETIRRNGQHLLELVNDILDLSRIEADRLEVECLPCSPSRILADVVDLLRGKAAERELALEIQSDGLIPETIHSDPTRLKQALMNLVGNAIKFSRQGTVRIVASCDRKKETLSLAVIDQGIGLTDEQIARLFRPFSQANASTTRQYGGTGLGLAITRRIAGLLGGTVRVTSQPGHGSTFTLSVATGPLGGIQMVSATDLRPTRMEPPTPLDELPVIRGRILLVEDGPDNQRLLAHFLRKAGAEVLLADNGREGADKALAAMAQGQPFDAILMDMEMPVMDGYTAARLLREQGYPGLIIALTAHAMKGDLNRCLVAGCDHYLSKPVSRDTLLRELSGRLASQPPLPETSRQD